MSPNGNIVGKNAVLIYGDRGTITRLTDKFSNLAVQLKLELGFNGDRVLSDFIGTTLPDYLRSWQPVDDWARKLTDIGNQRTALSILRTRTDAELTRVRNSPLSVLQRERHGLAFSDFMTRCRGDAAAMQVLLTKSCLDSWQAQETAAGRSWWEAIAEQTPPGILLLFLLATLGGLYRYNLRLAGFHESRADTLQLLAQGRDATQLRDILAATPGEAVNLATIFLAADKVEMGTIKAKLGQAEIELAKALNSSE